MVSYDLASYNLSSRAAQTDEGPRNCNVQFSGKEDSELQM